MCGLHPRTGSCAITGLRDRVSQLENDDPRSAIGRDIASLKESIAGVRRDASDNSTSLVRHMAELTSVSAEMAGLSKTQALHTETIATLAPRTVSVAVAGGDLATIAQDAFGHDICQWPTHQTPPHSFFQNGASNPRCVVHRAGRKTPLESRWKF